MSGGIIGIRSGKQERFPYSLSRWTDLPAAKWPWFEEQLDQGWFIGFDPKLAMPFKWSLKPEDTMGLVFWTREPTNLIKNAERLKAYPLVIHMTMTGWHEIEKGAPDLERSLFLMDQLVETFGAENVVWRFSPVPAVEDALERFKQLATVVESLGVEDVFVSFLQENDYVAENRVPRMRRELLKQMAASTTLNVQLCNEDTLDLGSKDTKPRNLDHGICESGARFVVSSHNPHLHGLPPAEGCGCALSVDPFTVNETCVFGCAYCYAADKTLAPKKRNTTTKRRLPLA